jgi:hypothetical protein
MSRLKVSHCHLAIPPNTPGVIYVLEAHDEQTGKERCDAGDHGSKVLAIEPGAGDFEDPEVVEFSQCGSRVNLWRVSI